MQFKVNEIFHSIQGESSFAGQRCTFIRLSGCNMRCKWCDTTYAFYEGEMMSLEAILSAVRSHKCKLVEITGGEPFMHPQLDTLVQKLLDTQHTVLIETNGSHHLGGIPTPVHKIVDLKPPSTDHPAHYLDIWEKNIAHLTANDEIKCVIASAEDYAFCVKQLKDWGLMGNYHIHFSPVWDAMEPKTLVEWILRDNLPVRLNIQWHKYIWSPDKRGV